MRQKHVVLLAASFLFAITFALSGCGTSPTLITQAIEVPKERVFAKVPVSTSTPASLTIIRDTGLQGIEHVFEFWVNGLQLAELKAGEKLTMSIEPGAVILEIRMFNVLGKIAPAQVETIFVPGRIYVYRAGIDDTPRLHLTRDVDLSK
jgi:hypothetical protein